MIRIGLLLALWLTSNAQAIAADSVVIGSGLSQKDIEGVEVPCEEGSVYPDVWFKWTIKVSETLSGPAISGRVAAALVQHAPFVPSYFKQLKVFVLRPISDPEQRKLLQAEYLLVDFSVAHTMYRLDQKPSGPLDDIGIYYGDTQGGAPYCIERRPREQ